MDPNAVEWLPGSPTRITDHQGMTCERPLSAGQVPRISRIRVTYQVGKEQTLATIQTEGIRGRWVWSKRVALVLLDVHRGRLEDLGTERFVALLHQRMSWLLNADR